MPIHAREHLATASRTTTQEQSLANRLEGITQALDRGEQVDLEELVAAYPEHAERLRELMPTMLAMASWGKAPPSNSGNHATVSRTSPLESALGDFRILSELGRGGMGTVYEAEQISMGRSVALKVLPFAALADGKALQRFRNEVRAAAALDHPNIVSVYSVGEERGIHYYSMQLIRGQSLAELIWQLRSEHRPSSEPNGQTESAVPTVDSAFRGPPSTKPINHAFLSTALDSRQATKRYRRAAELGIQAAEALQHAHDQGVLHRDIKPGNLMLDGEGTLYVTDFGLARIEADAGMTMTGDILGTLRYMAPEQALAKRVVIDHRADIYSLGATLYELLTLEPAFGESDRTALLKHIASEEPRPLRKIDRHLPAELETIVLKAMAKSPDERYQTSQDLADDLRAFRENRPIKATPPTILQLAAKWSRRNQAAMWAAIATLLVTGIALLVSQIVVSRANRELRVAKGELEGALVREADAADTARAAEHRSADLLFAADVRLAGEALDNNNVVAARERLARHIPEDGQLDRRGFAWHYLWGKLDQAETTFAGHGPAYDVEYSPDGKLLASSHESGEVVLYDTFSQQELQVLADSSDLIRKIDFSKDGKLLAGACEDGHVCVSRVRDGTLIIKFLANEPGPADVAFHPDGQHLATAAGSSAKLYQLLDGDGQSRIRVEKMAEFGVKQSILYAVAISADGNWIAAGGNDRRPNRPTGGIWVWNAQTQRVDPFRSFSRKVTALAFANHENRLVIGVDSGAVRLWDLTKEHKDIRWYHNSQRIYDLKFSHDDAYVVSASKDSTTWLWDLANQRIHRTIQGHNERVYGSAIHPSTSQIATASKDGTVKLWEPAAMSFSMHASGSVRRVPQASLAPDADVLVEVFDTNLLTAHDLNSRRSREILISTLEDPRFGWRVGANRLVVTGRGLLDDTEGPGTGNYVEMDCDRDGDLDRVATFGPLAHPIWQEKRGAQTYAAPRLLNGITLFRTRYYRCDVDGDGNDEILHISPSSGIWLRTENLVTAAAYGLGCADLDLDGDLDLVVPNRTTQTVAWYAQSRSSGGRLCFEKQSDLAAGMEFPASVVAADITGDDLPDVVASDWGFVNPQICFVKNLGGGDFGEPQFVREGIGPEFVDVADVDQDGWPDVLRADPNKIVWYQNLGKGHFSSTEPHIRSLTGATWLRPPPPRVTEIYDLTTLKLEHRILGDPNGGPSDTSLSPDGKHLALVSELEDIQIWELPAERLIHTIPFTGFAVHDVAYSPDGQYLLAAVGDELHVWDANHYGLIYNFQEHNNTIERVVVSADSKLAATVSDDMSVRLWSLDEGRQLRALLGHKSPPILAAFTRDGRRIATASEDATIRVWDTVTGQQLLALRDATKIELRSVDAVLDLAFRDEDTLTLAVGEKGRGGTVLAEWTATARTDNSKVGSGNLTSNTRPHRADPLR